MLYYLYRKFALTHRKPSCSITTTGLQRYMKKKTIFRRTKNKIHQGQIITLFISQVYFEGQQTLAQQSSESICSINTTYNAVGTKIFLRCIIHEM